MPCSSRSVSISKLSLMKINLLLALRTSGACISRRLGEWVWSPRARGESKEGVRQRRGKREKGLKLPPSLPAQAEELLSISV